MMQYIMDPLRVEKWILDGEWMETGYAPTEDAGQVLQYFTNGGGDDGPMPIEEMPSVEACEQAEAEYAEWVWVHGVDPLEEFIGISATYTQMRRYTVEITRTKDGPPVVCRWKAGRGEWHGANGRTVHFQKPVPTALAEYLGIDTYLTGPAKWSLEEYLKACQQDDQISKVTRVRRGYGIFSPRREEVLEGFTIHVRIEAELPRSPTAVANDLRKAAKAALATLRKRKSMVKPEEPEEATYTVRIETGEYTDSLSTHSTREEAERAGGDWLMMVKGVHRSATAEDLHRLQQCSYEVLES